MVTIDPLTLGMMGLQLIGGLLGSAGGGQQAAAENQREDAYNTAQAQGMYNFMNDYVMQPIGPAAGMPTLNDPSAFGIQAPQLSAQGAGGFNPMALAQTADRSARYDRGRSGRRQR